MRVIVATDSVFIYWPVPPQALRAPSTQRRSGRAYEPSVRCGRVHHQQDHHAQLQDHYEYLDHGSKPRHRRGCIATSGLNYVGVWVSLALSVGQELPPEHASCGAGEDQPHVCRRRELSDRSDRDDASRARG